MSVFWILVGFFVLGLMVLLHEWGHFIVAKLLGVRVEIFSIGFGPRLLGVQRGATDYRLSLLPLGGYVKMAGDNPHTDREGAPDEFLSQARWRRALIVLAGPGTNIILAVLLLAGLYAVRFEKPAFLDEPARLEGVIAGSPAARAGLQAGDVVTGVGSKATPTWEDADQEAQVEVLARGQKDVTVTIVRSGERLTRVVHPELQEQGQFAFYGWYPYAPIVVTEVAPQLAAARAGLRVGDEIVAMDGASTSEIGHNGFLERVQASKGAPVLFGVRRGGSLLELSIAPEKRTWRSQTGYFLGIGILPRIHSVQLSALAALKQSLAKNLQYAGLMFTLLQGLFTLKVGMGTLQGPIGITILSGQAAQIGWAMLLNFMAVISMNLGVLNLLPVPVMDGGHLALLAVEGVRRRDLSLGFKERITQVGVMLLLLLFAVVMYNDIVRYFFR